MQGKYQVFIVATIALVVGLGVGVGFGNALPLNIPTKPDVTSNSVNQKIAQINGDYNNLNKKIDELSKQVETLKNNTRDESGSKLSNLEKDVKSLNVKLASVSGDVKDFKNQIDALKSQTSSALATVFSADLDKSNYKAGDSLAVTGVGLPNRSVSILLLDSDGLILTQGSSTTDSNGKFTFSTVLSRSLAAGDYTIKTSQEGKVIQRSFKIVNTETSITQVPSQLSSGPVGLTISLDKSQYTKGDRVMISGKADPNVFIDFDIFYSNNAQIRTSVKSDSQGNYALPYTIPTDAPLGTYEIRASLGDKQASVKFSVESSVSSTPSSSNSGSLTITTDKTAYNRGDLVKITGKSPAYSKITITAQPPSGDTMIATTFATDSGNYITLLFVKDSASTGTWKLTAQIEKSNDIATSQIQVS